MADSAVESGSTPIFTLDEYAARLQRVRSAMSERDLDALMVMGPEDIFYLTGFRSMGFFAWQVLVVTATERTPLMISRSLEEIMYRDNSWADEYLAYSDNDDPIRCTADALSELGVAGGRIGLPDRSVYVPAAHARRLGELLPSTTWVDTTEDVAKIRAIKSAAELDIVRRVAPLTAIGFHAGAEAASEGASENTIAAAFLHAIISAGSHQPASGPYIGAGHRAAFGHASWEGMRLSQGDVVFFEASACLHRYHAPLMRTISVGVPSDEVRALEEASLAGADAAIAAARPGVTAGEVDAACRGAVRGLGLDRYFKARVGYSVGIGFTNWIDGFSVRPGEQTVLAENMVMHLLPFLSTGKRAVALSESVLIGPEGAERLIDFERSLITC